MPDGVLLDRSPELIEGYRELGLDALIGIGGDGSFAILRRLAQQGGFKLVGIPKTIDNDIGATENSVGYQSAVAVATEALDRLQPTAASHDRVMILEVMGRDAGHIALSAGIAGGADIILIPEIAYTIENVAAHIEKVRRGGRNFALIVVAEAVKDTLGQQVRRRHGVGSETFGGIGHLLGEEIARVTGAETRVTVLGHVQRGSQPNWSDRLIGSTRMARWCARRAASMSASAMPESGDPAGGASEKDAFWAFSLDFYGRPGVSDVCLGLQDRHGLDVNLVLLCCWLGWNGRGRLSGTDLAAAESAVATWRSAVVEPLRAVRRALKAMPVVGASGLRQEVQRLELVAEREAQSLLVAGLKSPLATPGGDPLADAAANLALYLAAEGRDAALARPLIQALGNFATTRPSVIHLSS
jgi:uncharacterized protein (TIGR02444 family)